MASGDDAEMRLHTWTRLKCRHSSLFLEVGGDMECAQLQQASYKDWDNQLFRFEPRSDSYGVLRVKHSSMVLDVCGGSSTNGAQLIQHTEHFGDNQLFRFHATAHGAGFFRAKHSGKVIGVRDASKDEGAEVQQWDECGVDNQAFSPESAHAAAANRIQVRRSPQTPCPSHHAKSSHPHLNPITNKS